MFAPKPDTTATAPKASTPTPTATAPRDKSPLAGMGYDAQVASLTPGGAGGAPPGGAAGYGGALGDLLGGILGGGKKEDPNAATASDVFRGSLEMFAFKGFTDLKLEVDTAVEQWSLDLGAPAEDPTPGWDDILGFVVGVGVNALTGGLGGVVGQHIKNAVVGEMKKEFWGAVGGNIAGDLGKLAFKPLTDAVAVGDGTGKTMKAQVELQSKRQIRAAIDQLDDACRKSILANAEAKMLTKDEVAQVCERVRSAVAAAQAAFPRMVVDTCMEIWLDQCAQSTFGSVKPQKGKGERSEVNTGNAARDADDASSAPGFLGIFLQGGWPTQGLEFEAVSLDRGPGGEDGVAEWLTSERMRKKPLRDLRVAKIISGEFQNVAGAASAVVGFPLTVTTDKSRSQWSTNTTGRGDDVWRWMAMRKLGRLELAPGEDSEANYSAGVNSFLDSVLSDSLETWGVTSKDAFGR